jgi:ribosome-binding factor A
LTQKYGEYSRSKIVIGDRDGKKATCFISYMDDEPEEKEMLDELAEGKEVLISCAKAIEDGKYIKIYEFN